MGLSRTDINGDKVFGVTKDIAQRSKDYGYTVNFGGGISLDAVDFICNLYPLNDRFETRKVVFNSSDNPDRIKSGIIKALEFETLYLKNKCEFYNRMSVEDQSRIEMMAEMLEINNPNLSL